MGHGTKVGKSGLPQPAAPTMKPRRIGFKGTHGGVRQLEAMKDGGEVDLAVTPLRRFQQAQLLETPPHPKRLRLKKEGGKVAPKLAKKTA